MQQRKKIGVIMPAITETLDASYLDGIYRQVRIRGYDTVVFTCSSNMQKMDMPTAYILAEESICRLAAHTSLDGLIVAAGKYHNAHVADRIISGLHGIRFPCVCTYYPNTEFPNVEVPQGNLIHEITEHLIAVHGFRRIFCLTGFQGNSEAEERLAGWRSAMEKAGLDTSQYRYGDFWLDAPKRLAQDIASGTVPMPEAVVCANDFMAIALCKQLGTLGFRVPEDIAVTGFDGGPNATLTEPSLTTVDGKEFDVGSNAAVRLLELFDGKTYPPVRTQHISFGHSCGCREKSAKEYFAQIDEKYIRTSAYRDVRAISDYINRMASAESIHQLRKRIAELSSLLPYWNDLYVCVRSDLTETDAVFGQRELPEQMQLFVSTHRSGSADDVVQFRTAEFLPAELCGDVGKLMIAVPLHNTETIFGYIVTTYTDPKEYVFDDLYVSWRDSVANALSVQYIKAQNRLLTERLDKLSERDRMTGMLNLKGLSRRLTVGQQYACILLAIGWVQTASSSLHITPELFVANAIQMNCSEGESCFRYNRDVFGVLLPVPSGLDPERLREEWIMRFDSFIELVRQSDKHLEKPIIHIYYDQFQMQENGMWELLERLIEGHLHRNPLPPTVKGGLEQQLEEIRRRMVRTPSEKWTMELIADAMQISVSYFRRLYKQHFGIPFHSDLIHLRMSHAMKLLRQTDMNIKTIAEQCGYANTFHFMTAFKKETGLTATEFRSVKQWIP